MIMPLEVWLQRIGNSSLDLPRFICFPHAGGSASFFRGWAAQLPEYQVYAVRYPGRGERIMESPPNDLLAMAAEVADAIAKQSRKPVVLFGHSMGAIVALECARNLSEADIPILHLFASGSGDGDEPEWCEDANEESDSDIIRKLVELGGTDAQIASDPDFQKLVIPYVRADSAMFHAYRMNLRPTLSCPVTAIVGDADADADRRPWHKLTAGVFKQLTVAGDHFYLISRPPIAVIRSALLCRTMTGRQISVE
jgi:surfactin synthase thioesterase subunit